VGYWPLIVLLARFVGHAGVKLKDEREGASIWLRFPRHGERRKEKRHGKIYTPGSD
jgi:hypothetical protein